MPSILNSDDGVVSGTSGLKSTGGNDGLLNIQSNGSTIVAVTGSGISVTGTVSQTGVSTFAAGTASAPSITFTGDTNTGIYSPGADITAFTQGGTERGRFNAAGYFKASYNGTYDSSTGSYHEFTGNAASNSTLFIYNKSTSFTNYVTEIIADRNTTNNTYYFLRCRIAGVADKLVVADSGAIGTAGSITLGSITPATSGIGVQFPATQSASTDANTLDDYEEGTWTPTLYGSSSAGTTTYSAQQGYYTKIGRAVTINCYIQISAMTGTGELQLGGLPFSNSSVARAASSGMVNGLNWGGGTFVVQYLDTSNNYISIYYCGDDASWAPQNCVNESIGFIFSMSYIV